MVDNILNTFRNVNHIARGSQEIQVKAEQICESIGDLEKSLTPPLTVPYSDDLYSSSFQTIKDIVSVLRYEKVAQLRRYNVDCIVRFPVAVFVNLAHQKKDITAIVTQMNHLLDRFAFDEIEAHVRCVAMIVETTEKRKYDKPTKQQIYSLALFGVLPILKYILSCNDFSMYDVAVLQHIFTMFTSCMRFGYSDENFTREWLIELHRIFEKQNLSHLYMRAHACFFMAFHCQKVVAENRMLVMYYAMNIEMLVDFVHANAHNIAYTNQITAVLVFICTCHESYADRTRPHAGKLLSALLTVFRVNAHHLIENHGQNPPYPQKQIEKFARSLLFCYPDTHANFIARIEEEFHGLKSTSLSSIIASINAMTCCSDFLGAMSRDIIYTWFVTRLPRLIVNRIPAMQSAVLRAVRAYLNTEEVAQNFLSSCVVVGQLIGNPILSEQIRMEIFSLLCEIAKQRSCTEVIRVNFRPIVREILRTFRDGGDSDNPAEQLLEQCYATLDRTPASIMIIMNDCASVFTTFANVPNRHIERFFRVLTELVDNCSVINFECSMKIREFLISQLEARRLVYREGCFTLLTSLVARECHPSVHTSKLVVKYIETAGNSFYHRAQSLCSFYYQKRPNSTPVVYAMIKLIFSLHYTPRGTFTSFFMWLSKKNISFTKEHSRHLVDYLKWLDPRTNSCLITMLCARIMSSTSLEFIREFLSDIDVHWSQEKFLDKWIDDSIRRQVILEVLHLAQGALNNALYHYSHDDVSYQRVENCLDYLEKKQEINSQGE